MKITQFLPVAEAAEILDMHVEAVRRRCRDGRMEGRKKGGRWLVAVQVDDPARCIFCHGSAVGGIVDEDGATWCSSCSRLVLGELTRHLLRKPEVRAHIDRRARILLGADRF